MGIMVSARLHLPSLLVINAIQIVSELAYVIFCFIIDFFIVEGNLMSLILTFLGKTHCSSSCYLPNAYGWFLSLPIHSVTLWFNKNFLLFSSQDNCCICWFHIFSIKIDLHRFSKITAIFFYLTSASSLAEWMTFVKFRLFQNTQLI